MVDLFKKINELQGNIGYNIDGTIYPNDRVLKMIDYMKSANEDSDESCKDISALIVVVTMQLLNEGYCVKEIAEALTIAYGISNTMAVPIVYHVYDGVNELK